MTPRERYLRRQRARLTEVYCFRPLYRWESRRLRQIQAELEFYSADMNDAFDWHMATCKDCSQVQWGGRVSEWSLN